MPDSSALLASAVVHHRAGRIAQAVALYERVLATDPNQPDALHLLGQIALHQGNAQLAESLFARAASMVPKIAALHLRHGIALRAIGRPTDALAAFMRATTLEPALAEAHHQTGLVLKSVGRYAEALVALREAVRLAPESAVSRLNLGVTALEAGQRQEALAAFDRAAILEPARPETHNIRGHTLASLNRNTEARAAFHEALRLKSNYSAAHDNLGRLDKSEGRLPEAVEHFRAALAVQLSPETHSNLLLALNYLPELDPIDVFNEHRRWNDLHAARIQSATPTVDRAEAPAAVSVTPALAAGNVRRLRIGYLSPDFVHHAVSYFIEPVLAAHDRRQFEVFCYANVRQPDNVTRRLRALSDHWREIAFSNDEAAAELVRRDQLDLLVDLAGHTAHHRLLVFARRPAPVQATWIGYPNTTGLDVIDYRITDAISDPVGATDHIHSEKLVRLPGPFCCYRPDDDAPPVREFAPKEPGKVTFGCFNNFAKVTPEVIAVWSRLLRELPASQLVLKSRGLADGEVSARVRAAFGAASVAPDRVCISGEELPVREHLSLYHSIDIALDPFPYNGTTTTCEALWMGVPVVTLAGRVHAARVGASLLTHIGLKDWIAATPEDYVRIATAAANDPQLVKAMRSTLRDRMRNSPLCDSTEFTHALEQAYVAMAARSV